VNKTAAILLAAGKSDRFGGELPKPFLLLNGKPIYQYSLDVFDRYTQIDFIIFVVPKDIVTTEKINNKKKNIIIIEGGKSRFESVQKALKELDDSINNIIIHDAARPFVTENLIESCLNALTHNSAVSCATESTDTVVITNNEGVVNSYPNRNEIRRLQTPQAFHSAVLKSAYALAQKEGKTNFTDDSSLIHYYQLAPICLVPGKISNIKITFPSDLQLAELIQMKFKA